MINILNLIKIKHRKIQSMCNEGGWVGDIMVGITPRFPTTPEHGDLLLEHKVRVNLGDHRDTVILLLVEGYLSS